MRLLQRLGERLPPPADPRQIDLLFRGVPLSAAVGIVEALFVSLPFWRHRSAALLVGWLLVFAVVRLGRLGLSHLHARHASAQQLPAWCAVIVVTAGLQAMVWGFGSWVLFAPDDLLAEALLHVGLMGVVLGGVAHLANYPPLLYTYVLCVFLPLFARDLWVGGLLHLLLAFTALMSTVYALVNGRRQAALLADTFAQRKRNEALIAELALKNEGLAQAQRAAAEALQSRVRFFDAANHDLRQPLHALGLLSQTLMQQTREQPELASVVRQMGDCVQGMGHLVDELLSLAQLDAGPLKPNIAKLPLKQVLDEVESLYRGSAELKGLQFQVDAAPVWVETDARLLLRVLANLVSNALRYTVSGHVLLRARVQDERVHIEVQDSGPGIPAHLQDKVFEPFFQVAGQASTIGLGLGLATVKRLADLLDLKLSLQSAPGQGSCFGLQLTRALPNALAQRAPDALPQGIGRLLVLEDDPQAAEALLQLLQAWHFEVRRAASLEEALAHLAQGFAPDVLLVDLRLAGAAHGAQAVALLRQSLQRAVPALVMTGEADNSPLMLAVRQDGLPLLRKPVKPLQLRAFLAEALSEAA